MKGTDCMIERALKIYEAGYGSAYGLPNNRSAKEFFIELREAIMYELETYGFCSLLDQLLESNPIVMDPITSMVFIDIGRVYNGKQKNVSDVEQEPYVPHLRSFVRWDDCHFRDKGIFIRDPANILGWVRQYGRMRHIEALQEKPQTVSQSVQTEQPTPMTEASETMLAQTKEETARILNEAREQEKKILQAANEERQRILNGLEGERNRILQDAREKAKEIERRAEEAAIASAEQRAEEAAKALISQHLADEQKRFKKECNEEIVALIKNGMEEEKNAEELHKEMCDRTYEYQANFVHSLKKMNEEMEKMKSDFYEHLNEWQRGLYPREFKPLASLFTELYRLINVDKLIREEILYGAYGTDASPSPAAVLGLQKLNKNLLLFLKKYEKALNGIGLYAFYPKQGEHFDEDFHTAENEDENTDGAFIVECLVPGIAKKASDGHDDRVIPALVKIRTSEGEA